MIVYSLLQFGVYITSCVPTSTVYRAGSAQCPNEASHQCVLILFMCTVAKAKEGFCQEELVDISQHT